MKKGQDGTRWAAEIETRKRQFIRAMISLGDIEESIDYLEAYNGNLPPTIRRAILLAAIISYCRPFFQNAVGSNNEATTKYKFHAKDLFDKEDRDLHNRLLALRKKVLAHSDFNEKPVSIDHVGKHGYSTSLRVFDLLSIKVKPEEILRLCVKVQRDCRNNMFSLSQSLADVIVKSQPLNIDGLNGVTIETTSDFNLIVPKVFRQLARNPGQRGVEVNLITGQIVDSPESKA